jgi:sugar lactone lactonase YvrE
MSLFAKHSNEKEIAHLAQVHPRAAMPGGEVQVLGRSLGPVNFTPPRVFVGDTPAYVALSRAERLVVRVPQGSVSADITVSHGEIASNGLPLRVAVPIATSLHNVSNPVADAHGNLFAAFSGDRGESVQTSVFRVNPDFTLRPHASGILNATGLALDRDQNLYVSSRHEGTIYRITPQGAQSVYAEGMGVATGLAFDADGNLYCGDRSGTIFKIAPDRQIYVFATLEPSVAAYHLCMAPSGTLFVTAPTTTSYDNVYAISTDGNVRVYYAGLGRPQGMACLANGDLLVAASLHGARGIVCITARGEASLAVAGPGIVGIAGLPEQNLVLATADTLYHLPH